MAGHAVRLVLTEPSFNNANAYCFCSGIHSFDSIVARAFTRIARAESASGVSPIASAIRAKRSSDAIQTPLRYTSDRMPICRSPTSSAPAPAAGFSMSPSPSVSVAFDHAKARVRLGQSARIVARSLVWRQYSPAARIQNGVVSP